MSLHFKKNSLSRSEHDPQIHRPGAIATRPASLSVLGRLVAIFCMCFWLVSAANAQVLYGSLTGNVTDPQGAAVPGAKVEMVNIATNDVRSITTDDRGGFTVNDLQPGVYRITVSMASFKTAIKENVSVETNKVQRIETIGETGDLAMRGGAQVAHRDPCRIKIRNSLAPLRAVTWVTEIVT